MANIPDRRTDVINSHEVRLAILETHFIESKIVREHHSKAIDDLDTALHETTTALREGIRDIAAKFDSLMSQFKIGFIILTVGTAIFVALFSGFYLYSQDLDKKYTRAAAIMNTNIKQNTSAFEKQSEVVTKQTEAVAEHTDAVTEAIVENTDDIAAIKRKKVIKASR